MPFDINYQVESVFINSFDTFESFFGLSVTLFFYYLADFKFQKRYEQQLN